ncbi:uncharacterized protein [Diabrotica undecimpunctata]|uniref:uncharacterized protein n=1 Tax=Diabrotica undecimpunctata TaxID=50387 RepID=UPI003B6411DA
MFCSMYERYTSPLLSNEREITKKLASSSSYCESCDKIHECMQPIKKSDYFFPDVRTGKKKIPFHLRIYLFDLWTKCCPSQISSRKERSKRAKPRHRSSTVYISNDVMIDSDPTTSTITKDEIEINIGTAISAVLEAIRNSPELQRDHNGNQHRSESYPSDPICVK